MTSANVACGFHAGDPAIMVATCAAAHARGVRIGAHLGYRDLAGFGRRALAVPPGALADEATYQLGALAACAGRSGARVTYVKPHGALYHRCAADPEAARALLGAVRAFDPGLPVLGPPGSALLIAARELGLPAVQEGFADRAYAPDGGLLDRSAPGAVLAMADARRQATALAAGAPVPAAGGGTVPVQVESICVHGDTPGAVELAREVRRAVEEAGCPVRPFA